jgi:hypothetical protein
MGEAKRRQKLDPNYGKQEWEKEDNHEVLEIDPDYQNLVDLYLEKGLGALTLALFNWLLESGQVYEKDSPLSVLSRVNQIGMTVCEMASKQSKTLTSHKLKLASFNLKIPLEPDDFGSYMPVVNNREIAIRAMSLINSNFFDTAITMLINSEGDSVGTLRKHGIVLYMGTNYDLDIIDAACCLVTWKPFKVVAYVGEQRNSLNGLIENTFRSLANGIQTYRVEQKGANKFPCLSLLCLIENKSEGTVCEFRRHFSAQSGGQLIISGFNSSMHGTVSVSPPLNILGFPSNKPNIRGFKG